MQVLREDVVRICEALDFTTARKWNKKKTRQMLVKMAKLVKADELEVEGTDDDERLNAVLVEIVKAGGEVEVVQELDEVEAAADAPEKAEVVDDAEEGPEGDDEVGPPEEEPEPADEELEAVEDEASKKDPKPKAKKGKAGKKKDKGEKAEAGKAEEGNPVGVRSIRNRLFAAGAVLKASGLEAGLTEELVDKVDGLCTKPNKVASKVQLSYAWHAIDGYLNG